MREDKTGLLRLVEGLKNLCAAFVLAGILMTLGGCATVFGGASSDEEAVEATESTSEDSQEDAASADTSDDDEAALEDLEGATSFDVWEPECLDNDGNVTVYAVSELKGWQLEMLLQEQEYSWSTRNQLWVNADNSVAVAVLDAEGQELSDEQIAELGIGCMEGSAGYRIVTSRYSSAKKAFDALVGKVMVCVDSEFAETSGIAVVFGPSMHRSLVFVSTSNDVVILSLYSEDAVKAGLFDRDAGRELGATVEEAFENVTGRTLADTDES